MRLLPLKSEADLVREYQERCTRRIPLGAVLLAGYIAVALIFAGAVRITANYEAANDPYVGLCDGPYSY